MDGEQSIDNSINFSQLSFLEKLNQTDAEGNKNTDDNWAQNGIENENGFKADMFLGSQQDEQESNKSKKGDIEVNENLSVKSFSGTKSPFKESRIFKGIETNFSGTENIQKESNIIGNDFSPFGKDSPDKVESQGFIGLEATEIEGKIIDIDEDIKEIEQSKQLQIESENEEQHQSQSSSPKISVVSQKKRSSKELLEIGPNGKFKISNKKLSLDEKKERYKEIVYNFASEAEVVCLICLDGEAFTNDDIYFCDLCNTAFHQSCFGSELLDLSPEDEQTEWFCHRCSYLSEFDLPFNEVRCEFCPEIKGVVKRIRPNADKHWGHVNCVNWIPEIYYKDGIEKVDVFIAQYWKKNSCGRKKLLCNFCKIPYGDCINCDGEKCKATFHVTCAEMHGLIACWKDMIGMKRENDTEYYLPIYCKEHMKNYRTDMFEFSNKIEKKNLAQIHNISFLYNPGPQSASKQQTSKTNKTNDKKAPAFQKQEEEIINSPEPMEVEKPSRRRLRRSPLKIEPVENIFEPAENIEKRRSTRLKDREIAPAKVNKQTVQAPEIPLAPALPLFIKAKKTGSFIGAPVATTPAKKSVAKDEIANNKPNVETIKSESSSLIDRDYPEEEEKSQRLFKLKPILANILKFYEWGTEKEIKKEIQKYLLQKRLYNREKKEVEVGKDVELETLLKSNIITKENIFKSFLPYMYEKKPEMLTIKDDEDLPFFALYEKELKKAKEAKILDSFLDNDSPDKLSSPTKTASNSLVETIKPKRLLRLDNKLGKNNINTSTQVLDETSKDNIDDISIFEKPFEKSDIIPVKRDINYLLKETVSNNSTSNKNVEEIKHQENGSSSLNSKRGNSLFDLLNKGDETYQSKKVKLNPEKAMDISLDTSSILSSILKSGTGSKTVQSQKNKNEVLEGLAVIMKSDHLTFRKNMNWLTQSELSLDGESITSNQIMQVLWPKGAEILF